MLQNGCLMLSDLNDSIDDAIRAIKKLKEKEALEFIQNLVHLIVHCYQHNGKLLICGNGGSLCDAMHFAEELTGQFREKRKALGAIALSDPGHMSCVANDMGYEKVFSRGVEALGKEEDLLIVLTTSGNSVNLIEAVNEAKKRNIKTIAFLGKEGGKLKGICDLEWIVKGFKTSDRIQEVHMAAIHIIIEMVEKVLFDPKQILKNVQTKVH